VRGGDLVVNPIASHQRKLVVGYCAILLNASRFGDFSTSG